MRGIGPHPTLFLLVVLVEIVCGFVLTKMIFDMAGELNGKLPDQEGFSYLGWHWSKFQRLLREYKLHFPDSTKPRNLRVGFLFMTGLIVVVWALGIFP